MFALNEVLFISRFFSIYFTITGARNMFVIRRGFRYIEVHHSADIFFLKHESRNRKIKRMPVKRISRNSPIITKLLNKAHYLIG